MQAFDLKQELKKIIKGDVVDDASTIEEFSRDASVCRVVPKIIVRPKNVEDIKALVRFVGTYKKDHPEAEAPLSLTMRSGGTDMTGGPLNDSIIVDMTAHFQGIVGWKSEETISVLPGTFYRDFEKETLSHGRFMPSYPASKNICTVGGMVSNNSAGEKTLTYGQTIDYVESLKVILSDGNEYELRALTPAELQKKILQKDVEGAMYAKLWKLISDNDAALEAARPKTAKNSAGYFLWRVFDKEKGTFDLVKLFVGSQGTLGIVTEITFRTVPKKKYSKMLTVFMPTLDRIGDMVNDILPYGPESLESYDEATLKLAIKYFPDLIKKGHGIDALRLIYEFIPEFWISISGGFPKLVMLIEFCGDNEAELLGKITLLRKDLKKYPVKTHVVGTEEESKKFWTIRRESYNLLRMHGAGKKVAVFIEDVVVPPASLPQFLPELRAILNEYSLTYSIAGHAGSGNFHVFPLMDFNEPRHKDEILEISDKVYDLVLKYGGSITAEHSDGIVRTPYLERMYGTRIVEVFKATKQIFDPENIFNPGKKVGGTKAYFLSHIV